MRFFFRSKQFKITLLVVAIVIALSATAAIIGGSMSPQTSLFGAIAAPFQKLGNSIASAINEFSQNFESAAKLNAEKDELQQEVNQLREQLVDYQSALTENDFYKNYLGIKDSNPDFQLCPALATSRDPDDIYGGFTVDSGSLDGVALYDPVITHEGLVGYVTQVGLSTCKITTILDPQLTCGAYDSRTNDAGALSGDTALATQGQTRFFNLPRTCSVAIGDLVVTSGSGIFPDKLIIGTVSNINSDPLSSSLYATVEPAAKLEDLRSVMIITDFTGQGNELIGED